VAYKRTLDFYEDPEKISVLMLQKSAHKPPRF